ncbi:MAG: S41 family peptidase [Steroidobacteraceae bacterium]
MTTCMTRLGVSAAALFAALLLTGCGGGVAATGGTVAGSGTGTSTSGSGSSGTGSTGSGSAGGTTGTPYVAGQYLPVSSFAAKCASPRSGTDPFTNMTYPDVQGTSTDENNYLRSWTHQYYLWFDQVPDLNPASYTTADYFQLMKSSATTSSGAPEDKPQFHFSYVTSAWEALESQGVQAGYGVDFVVLAPLPPRSIRVAYVEPNAGAQAASLARGATVQSIDGTDVNVPDQAGVNVLIAGLQPITLGETHTFVVLDVGASTPRTVTLTAANVIETPVPVATTITSNGSKVGYIQFNSHIQTAESELVDAFTTLKQQGVSDLVLDLRYNGGGLLDIASEVAFMIAGSAQTTGRTFELQQFNSKYPTTNPFVGGAITPTLFHSTSQGFSVPLGQTLPSLNLNRVFVLTGAGTCSASESIMNSLRGINVAVIQIGSTTCGKPYGFYPQENCGTTYFSIQFRGVNDQGFGDYSDGFSPSNTLSPPGVTIPGCSVADDFNHALGDVNEGQLSAALSYRTGDVCTVPPTGSGIRGEKEAVRSALEVTAHSPIRDMRILRQ